MKTVIAAFRDLEAADQAASELSSNETDNTHDVRILDGTDGEVLRTLEEHRAPRDRAEIHAEAVRRGAAVVVVDVDDEDAQRIAAVLDSFGSLDIDTAAQRWRTSGWTGYTEGSERFDTDAVAREREELERESLALIQEEVEVGKRTVERGGVRVRAFVTEQPVQTVQLREERVNVSRDAVDQLVAITPDPETFTEQEYVVTAESEEPVVQKQARVVERVHVGKEAETRTDTIEETECRRHVQVEPVEPTPRR